MRRVRRVASLLLAVAALVWLGNSSFLVTPDAASPVLLAHRGLGQDFNREGLTAETCTAARMLPSGHEYLENTIASMRAAFDYGAHIVEFDIHPTTDGHFAVFHDWTLECRTNGTGVTREQSLGYLKTLDLGHGYTADGGRTFPFRGKAVGQMPSLDEVLDEFPDRSFLIHIKSNDRAEADLLSARLRHLPPNRLRQLTIYGGSRPIEAIRTQLPDVRTMSGGTLQHCLLRYAAMGWFGYTPAACSHTMLYAPANIAVWLWGWPHRFVKRMAAADTMVFLQEDYRGSGFTTGLNEVADLERVPVNYEGGIWTDRIDLIGPAIRQRRHATQ